MTVSLSTPSVLGAAAAIASVVTHLYAEPFRWWFCYLRNHAKWTQCRDLFLTTALASYVLPFKLGVPLRLVLISRYVGLDRMAVGGLMAVDGALVLSAWCLVSFVIGGPVLLRAIPLVSVKVLCIAVLTFCLLLIIAIRRLASLRARMWALVETMRREPGRALYGLALSVLDVLSYGPRHLGLALVLGEGWHDAFSWSAVGILATFIGIVSGLPLGLLGYDVTVLTLAASQGLKPETGLAILACNRTISIGAAFCLGVPSAYRLGLAGSVHGLFSKLRNMNGEK